MFQVLVQFQLMELIQKVRRILQSLENLFGIVFQNPENQIIFNNVHDDMIFALDNLGLDKKEERIKEALKQVRYGRIYGKRNI